jgi:hypothetical protein
VPDDATDLTAGQRAAFLGDELYFNAHTAAGERRIRGQLDKQDCTAHRALGAQSPPVTTPRSGGILAVDATTGDGGVLVTAASSTRRRPRPPGGARDARGDHRARAVSARSHDAHAGRYASKLR